MEVIPPQGRRDAEGISQCSLCFRPLQIIFLSEENQYGRPPAKETGSTSALINGPGSRVLRHRPARADLAACGRRPRSSPSGPPSTASAPPPLARDRVRHSEARPSGTAPYRSEKSAQAGRTAQVGPRGAGGQISSPRQGEGAPLCALLLYLAGIRRSSRGQTPRVVRLQGPHNPLCTQPLKAKGTEEVGHTQGFLSWAGDSCLGR